MVRPVTAGTVIRASCPQHRVLPPISLLRPTLFLTLLWQPPSLAPLKSCQLGMTRKKGQREG